MHDDASQSRIRTHESRVVEGTVMAQLPSGLYRVEIDGPHQVMVHVGGGSGRNFVRLLVGDRVEVELMPRDRTRGRVVRKIQESGRG